MTVLSWLGIGWLVIMVTCGILIKRVTNRKVKGLYGLKGFMRKRDEDMFGNVVLRFEDVEMKIGDQESSS